MEIAEFKEKIIKYLQQNEIIINDIQIKQFYSYMNLLIEWNKNINLTAINEPNEIILKHFIDSIVITKYIKENTKLIDIGSGAGFPGIPIKILRPDIQITLVDSLNKRIHFLNEVIDELQLKEIVAIHGRAEEIGKDKQYREKFDYTTSRAVANISTLSEYCIPLIKLSGRCIFMKGPDIKEELKKGKNAIKVLGGKVMDIDEFLLPLSDIKRTVLIVEKIKRTPIEYPRKAGIPSKDPIL